MTPRTVIAVLLGVSVDADDTTAAPEVAVAPTVTTPVTVAGPEVLLGSLAEVLLASSSCSCWVWESCCDVCAAAVWDGAAALVAAGEDDVFVEDEVSLTAFEEDEELDEPEDVYGTSLISTAVRFAG